MSLFYYFCHHLTVCALRNMFGSPSVCEYGLAKDMIGVMVLACDCAPGYVGESDCLPIRCSAADIPYISGAMHDCFADLLPGFSCSVFCMSGRVNDTKHQFTCNVDGRWSGSIQCPQKVVTYPQAVVSGSRFSMPTLTNIETVTFQALSQTTLVKIRTSNPRLRALAELKNLELSAAEGILSGKVPALDDAQWLEIQMDILSNIILKVAVIQVRMK
jgi:hypothetical protein